MFTTFSGKEWTTWIVTVCAINVYFGHYHHVGSVYLVGFNLVNMINVYSIGTALRNPKLRITSIGGGILAILLICLMLIRYAAGKVVLFWNIEIKSGEYCSPVVIFMAVVVFLLFRNISIAQNKIISFFSTSAVSVYLLTEYPTMRHFLTDNFRELYLIICPNQYAGFIFVFAYAIILFVVCTVIDKVRILFQKRIENYIIKTLKI